MLWPKIPFKSVTPSWQRGPKNSKHFRS